MTGWNVGSFRYFFSSQAAGGKSDFLQNHFCSLRSSPALREAFVSFSKNFNRTGYVFAKPLSCQGEKLDRLSADWEVLYFSSISAVRVGAMCYTIRTRGRKHECFWQLIAEYCRQKKYGQDPNKDREKARKGLSHKAHSFGYYT